MKNYFKNSKAITLIALVITIIVLIILAGCSINLLFGDNGLITRAKNASKEYSLSKVKEEMQIILMDYSAEEAYSGITLENYLNKKEIDFQIDGDSILIEKNGYLTIIDKTTLEITGISTATKMSKAKVSSKIVNPGESINVTLEFGQDVDIDKCKYVFVKKTGTAPTKEQITQSVDKNNLNISYKTESDEIATYELYLLVTYKDGTESIVKKAEVNSGTPVESIILNKTSIELDKGNTFNLTAQILPNNATIKEITWNSEDTSIAIVNSEGLVTAVGKGTTQIIATSKDGSGITEKCNVTVNPTLVSNIQISISSTSLYVGNEYQMTKTVLPDNADNKNVIWNSSNKNVATVDENGVITPISGGKTTISAKSIENSNILSNECEITVFDTIQSISISSESINMELNDTASIIATTNPTQSEYVEKIIYESSNNNIVMVDENGNLTSKGVTGTATITIKAEKSDVKRTCTVTVKSLITNGLVDYWKLQGSLNNEISGRQNLTNFRGTATVNNDGVYLEEATILATPNDYDLGTTYTIIIQAKDLANYSGVGYLVGIGRAGGGAEKLANAIMRHTNGYMTAFNGNGYSWNALATANSYTNSDWNTFAIKFDGNTWAFYINGVLYGSKNSGTSKTGKLYIGGMNESGTNSSGTSWGYANGKYKNLVIYNRGLSDSEIAEFSF